MSLSAVALVAAPSRAELSKVALVAPQPQMANVNIEVLIPDHVYDGMIEAFLKLP